MSEEKSDPSNVRMMSKAQAEQGSTAADVIGTRKPDPKDWEIKYAPADTPRGRAKLQAIFDELPEQPDLDGTSGSIISDGTSLAHLSVVKKIFAKVYWDAGPSAEKNDGYERRV